MKKIFNEVESLVKQKGLESSAIQISKVLDNFGEDAKKNPQYRYKIYVADNPPCFFEGASFKNCLEKLKKELIAKKKISYYVHLIKGETYINGKKKISKKQYDELNKIKGV